ncbi:MarR family winged helix-turn-helix transcriptional regulator [Macrococcoides canis]|uniref:Multidrug resistance operon repressor n=2 Tax=Macrococcoides canis TaxID=1855823 RepID=A0A1W7AA74_9STAP|nr:winged helix DNA-binding protein [Macrococcus canis]ARQ06519.1 Multidrug resistance operon repressor [Macrococcus canis]UJS28608.1 winged helix DNA-binding protein [Macrococcus canis]UTH00844.1 winged helix DNA-binding protein [Macrococcus canis]WBF52148.1 winged helix DNA-binding protein [Macrococcus canis]
MEEKRLKRFGQLIYFLDSKIDEIAAAELSDYTLTRDQLYMLELIMNDEQMTQKKLIYKLNREQTSISRAIKKLFESGLVKKEQSKFDMRSSVLKPTDKGLEIIKQSQEIKMKVVRNFMKELSTEESEQLIMLLEKIYDSFALRDPFRF